MSIFIGVGSNISQDKNILKALALLQKSLKVIKTSTFYQTKAIGPQKQDSYYNGVWQIESTLPPEEIKFNILRKVENNCGRTRSSNKFAPREIDLDLLLYHDKMISYSEMKIPDPDLYSRNFIAFPLAELDPNLVIPDTKKTINAIISSMKKDNMVALVEFTQILKERIGK